MSYTFSGQHPHSVSTSQAQQPPFQSSILYEDQATPPSKASDSVPPTLNTDDYAHECSPFPSQGFSPSFGLPTVVQQETSINRLSGQRFTSVFEPLPWDSSLTMPDGWSDLDFTFTSKAYDPSQFYFPNDGLYAPLLPPDAQTQAQSTGDQLPQMTPYVFSASGDSSSTFRWLHASPRQRQGRRPAVVSLKSSPQAHGLSPSFAMSDDRSKRWSTGSVQSTPTLGAVSPARTPVVGLWPSPHRQHCPPSPFGGNDLAFDGGHLESCPDLLQAPLHQSPGRDGQGQPVCTPDTDRPVSVGGSPATGLLDLVSKSWAEPPNLYASIETEQLLPPDEDLAPLDPAMIPHEQNRRNKTDMYTPTYVRGQGHKREGWCGFCKRWLVLKNSAYWYDKSFSHGISAATGHVYEAPVEFRRARGQRHFWEGRCGNCNVWVSLINSRKKGTSYFRHAYKCHAHQKIVPTPKRRRNSGELMWSALEPGQSVILPSKANCSPSGGHARSASDTT